MGDFKKLLAWQKAHAFSIAVHKAFDNRRAHRSAGFRAQILKAVNSIPDNLAEGCGKRSRRALAAYAATSYSSTKEARMI
jgi:four helix bundle protein